MPLCVFLHAELFLNHHNFIERKESIMSSAESSRNIGNEIIRPRDLHKYTGLSRTTIWRLEKENKFVQKIFLTKYCIGYRLSDIERWIEKRALSTNFEMEKST